MWNKIKNVLSSIRFWIITFAWLAVYLGVVEKNGFSSIELFNQLAGWLATVAGVGTIDKYIRQISNTSE